MKENVLSKFDDSYTFASDNDVAEDTFIMQYPDIVSQNAKLVYNWTAQQIELVKKLKSSGGSVHTHHDYLFKMLKLQKQKQ